MLALFLWLCAAMAAPTVAIADLQNQTGDATYDGAGAGVAGILVSRFQQTDAVRVIERDALVSLLAEQQLTLAGLTQPTTAARAGRLLGAEYVVVGELFSVSLPTMSVAVRIVDTETGEVVASRDVVGDVGPRGEHFFTLIDQISEEVLQAVEAELTGTDRAAMTSIERRELDAVLRYGDDLIRVRADHPMSLYRESDRDFSREDFHRTRWMVHEQSGLEVPMPEFARRVGDDATYAEWSTRRRRIRRRALRTNLLTAAYGVVGIGLIAGGSTLGDRDGDPETPSVAQWAGLGVVMIVPVHFTINIFSQSTRRQGARYPGTFYKPEEADRWINGYNRSLR